LSKTGIIFSTLLLVSSTVNADFFSDTLDWAIDNPELSIPIGMSTGHNLGYQHSYSPITLRMLKLLIFYSFLHLYFNLKIIIQHAL
jgi:hypothetical protein